MSSIKIAVGTNRVLNAVYKSANNSSTKNCFVLVHGADRQFQNSKHWTSHMDFFSKHGSIYAVDMLGHGDSEPGAKDDIQKVSPDEQVRALETLINEEKQKNSDTKFVLVGRSYGGTVVCKLAKNLSPAQIKGLILIAPAASRDVVNELPKDAYPVLLVWARDDPILPFSHSEYFNHFERLQTCFFDNIVTEEIKQKGEQWRGHSSENERPEEFHKKVEEFLQ